MVQVAFLRLMKASSGQERQLSPSKKGSEAPQRMTGLVLAISAFCFLMLVMV